MRLFILQKNNRGFTVLFAVVVSSLVLAIGVSIANITLKQIQISTAGRESQIAFYAADSGAECAIYADLNLHAFPPNQSGSFQDFNCFGSPATDVTETQPEGHYKTTFTIQYQEAPNYCAIVSIEKVDSDGDGFAEKTTILSRGYNTCDSSSQRRLERGLEIRY